MTKHIFKCNDALLQVKQCASLDVASTNAKRKKKDHNMENSLFSSFIFSTERLIRSSIYDTDKVKEVNKTVFRNNLKLMCYD